MSTSILGSVKASLGVPEEATNFDTELLMYINSAISDLHQLGVPGARSFVVSGQSETWGDLLDDPLLNHVQSYVSLKVRMVFDPPEVGHTSSAFQRHLDELTWRITNTTDLGTADYEPVEEPVILDGGSP